MGPPNVDDVVAERYELKAPLRGRSVSRTFLANDDQTATLVALTWFAPENVTTATWKAFTRVVEAAARVPGLVLHRGLPATPTDPPHAVAELPLGQGFDRVRQSGWKEVLVLGERVAEILEEAYAATRVAHRALTPSRLCTGGGQVRVLDFGVAELERTNPDEPAYRAPEQPEGEDPRVDIYALAVILFEMIAGTLPKSNQRLRDFAAVPREFDELITRALRPDPRQRFPDYAAFRAALRAAGGMPSLQPLAPAPAPVSPALAPVPAPLVVPAPASIATPAWSKPARLIAPLPAEMTLRLPDVPTPPRPSPPAAIETTFRSPVAASPPRSTPGPSLSRSLELPTEVLPPVRRGVTTTATSAGALLPQSRESTEVLPRVMPGGNIAEPPSPALAPSRSPKPLIIGATFSKPPIVVSGRPPRPNVCPRVVPADELETMAFRPTRRPPPYEPSTQMLARPEVHLRDLESTSGLESRTEFEQRVKGPLLSIGEGTRLAGDNTLREVRRLAQATQVAIPEESVSAPALAAPSPVQTRPVPWTLIAINITFGVVVLLLVLLVGCT